jgi:hypothetical protein
MYTHSGYRPCTGEPRIRSGYIGQQENRQGGDYGQRYYQKFFIIGHCSFSVDENIDWMEAEQYPFPRGVFLTALLQL